MKKISLLPILLIICYYGFTQRLSTKEFEHPTNEFRPWIFWDWMNDMITKKGITSDLEQFKQFGIAGTLIMLVGGSDGGMKMGQDKPIPNSIKCMSPEFFSAWKFAAEESNRLGLTISSQPGPGWSHSGGPWIKPEQAVQHIAFSETKIEGHQQTASILIDNTVNGKGIGFHSEIATKDTLQWVQVDLGESKNIDSVILHPLTNNGIDGFGFPKKFKLEIADNEAFISPQILFEQTTSIFQNPKNNTVHINGRRLKGRYVRFTSIENFSRNKEGKYQYFLALGEMEVFKGNENVASNALVSASSSIEQFNFTKEALTDGYNLVSTRGNVNEMTLTRPGFKNYTADIAVFAYPDKPIVKINEIIDLTAQNKNGRIEWIVPDGKWIVRRYAMQNALAYNRPAPEGGKGFECDKLDKAAVDSIFEGMVGKFIKNSPKLVGTTIKGIEADSWEVGNPEWSPKFAAEFMKRRGYNPIPWLITYKTNQIVDNKNLTDRFNSDVYLTQTDLFADNFFSHMKEKCEQKGMVFMTEPYYGPFDPVRCGGRTHIPMGEFWASGDCMNSTRWAASAGHTYGRKVIGAEAFTGRWCDGNWRMDPYGLKRVGDLAFCNGINRFVLHGAALQPWGMDVKPGMPMHFWGTMFLPGQTWWQQGKVFTDYISRCQYILRQGINVADIAVLMPTVNWKESTPEGMHQYYNYDHIAEELLVQEMNWENGYFTLPSGAKYKVLLLPKTNGSITVETAKKLLLLAQKGGTIICQDKPYTSTGLSNYPQSEVVVKNIVSQLWGNADGVNIIKNQVGNGLLIWMEAYSSVNDLETEWLIKDRPVGKAFYNKPAQTNHWSKGFMLQLQSLQLKPDVNVLLAKGTAMVWGGFEETVCGTRENNDAINWVHRIAGDSDIYFVASTVASQMNAEISFRVTGKEPQLWLPESGLVMKPNNWKVENGCINITLPFSPYESMFIVFTSKQASIKYLPVLINKSITKTIPIEPKWLVCFAKGWGAPDSTYLGEGSWTNNENAGIKYYSGTANYSTSIYIDKNIDRNKEVWLNLGKVRNIAEILVNGTSVGIYWKPPFAANITSLIKKGNNLIEVKITNTWNNRLIGDEQYAKEGNWDKKMVYKEKQLQGYRLKEIPDWIWTGAERPVKERFTFTTWNFFEKDSPLEVAGLLGPVRLEIKE